MSFCTVLIVHKYRVLLITPVTKWGQLISYQHLLCLTHIILPTTEEELCDYGMDKIAKLPDFYGVAQKVNFDGQEGESEPDVDLDDTERSENCFIGLFSNNTGIIQYIRFCQS